MTLFLVKSRHRSIVNGKENIKERTELLTEYLFDCHDTAVLLVDRLPNNAVSLVTCAKKKKQHERGLYTCVFD